MKTFYTIIIWMVSLQFFAQNVDEGVPINSLELPSSPAFTLMDITPSNIITSDNIRELSVQTINAFTGGDGDGLGQNIAIEVQPYWLSEKKGTSFFKYNNLTSSLDNPTIDDYDGYNIFGDLWKKASISIAYMDGAFEVFEEAQTYVSVGVRTRLITFKSKKIRDSIKAAYKPYGKFLDKLNSAVVQLNQQNASIDEIDKKVKDLKSKYEKNNLDDDFKDITYWLNQKQGFSLDIAAAYSHFLGDKSKNQSDEFGRFGIWLSGDYTLKIPSNNNDWYFHVYGTLRYLRDGLNVDPLTNDLFITNLLDVGGKVELEYNDLSFAYEYISREGDTEDSRSIGTIKYRINKSLSLVGGFGKNFMSEGNTVSVFGIQWGIDSEASVK
ncbi:hypothetical protein [Aquimarina aggregata]|uniref:hypothetical protein n=1 Tax=Aquimarina aggregata TaxID=1642818 RepID=UPI00248FB19A|nr:hypothetical protein [Aquimarina aggregata]